MSELKKPDCFGNLEKVFPMSDDGIRKSPGYCIRNCKFNKECINMAVNSSAGKKTKEERIDAMYESGNINFFARWARKKSLNKKNENQS